MAELAEAKAVVMEWATEDAMSPYRWQARPGRIWSPRVCKIFSVDPWLAMEPRTFDSPPVVMNIVVLPDSFESSVPILDPPVMITAEIERGCLLPAEVEAIKGGQLIGNPMEPFWWSPKNAALALEHGVVPASSRARDRCMASEEFMRTMRSAYVSPVPDAREPGFAYHVRELDLWHRILEHTHDSMMLFHCDHQPCTFRRAYAVECAHAPGAINTVVYGWRNPDASPGKIH